MTKVTERLEGPLAGVRILDLTRILAGPYATLMLADLGADVIKLEHPGRGDDTRHWGPPFLQDAETSTYFASLNRGKRSVALDLGRHEDRERLYSILSRFDVAIDNFRPGVAERLGVSPAALQAHNPRLVTASIRGFPRGHPLEDHPGTEIVVEALSGLMEVTGEPGGAPTRLGIAMVDIASGLTTATRILAEVLAVRSGSMPVHIEVSLYQTALASLGTLITSFTASGVEPSRWGSHHPTICPYGAFPCKGGYVVTGAIHDRSWQDLCGVLGLDELASREDLRTNAGRVEHRPVVEGAISARTRTLGLDELVARLREAGLLAAPVRRVSEAVHDELEGGGGLLVGLTGGMGTMSPRLDGRCAHASSEESVPELGEHTEQVLAELGRGTIDAVAERADSHQEP